MTAINASILQERISRLEVMPSIPAVIQPLIRLLNAPPESVKLEEVVRLASYDSNIAAQCLRAASSPLFGLSKPPDSVKAAVISLGLRRVQTILLTCCIGQAFAPKRWILDPIVFWRHSLGCAMVCRKFSEKIAAHDHEKAYIAGLLHDIGLMLNSIIFPEEFSRALEYATREQVPLAEAELTVMGITHSETGSALAQSWNLSQEIVDVIAHHHHPEQQSQPKPLVALVHLADLLCRMRNLDYGYYEKGKVDFATDPAWTAVMAANKTLKDVDMVRFTFELDDALLEIYELVSNIFGAPQRSSRQASTGV